MNSTIFIIASILLNIFGQFSIKYGVNQFGNINLNKNIFNVLIKLIFQPYVILGLLIYAIGSVFWILALSKNDLSFAYPLLSIGYILILVISYFFLKEEITFTKILGVILISAGICFIFLSNKQ